MEEGKSLLNGTPTTTKFVAEGKSLWRTKAFSCIPARYVLAVISCIGFTIVFGLRVNISMALVVMVNSTADTNSHLQYRWNSQQQGWILSAFYIGYFFTQLPGGYLASRFGGRWVYGIGILITSILTLFTPLAAELHIGALIGLRILEGMFEGVTFPAMHAILGKWSPPKERSIIAGITYLGSSLGIVISFPVSAVLCEHGFAGGWPSVFYVYGCSGIIWFVLWFILGFSSPSTHPRITDSERRYIESSIKEEESSNTTTQNVPWLSILTSPPVWAIMVAFFCFGWINFSLITVTPTYFKNVLKLTLGKNLIENGIFSALPYIGFGFVSVTAGPIADVLRKKCLSTVVVRKAITTIGLLVQASGLIAVGYLGSSKVTCVAFLVLISSFSGLINAGHGINHIDIAPQYAGILMGITNAVGTIPGIVGPIVAETIAHTPPPGTDSTLIYREEWKEVFIIAAEIGIFGAIIYLLLAQGERQWWAGGQSTGSRGSRIVTMATSRNKTTNKQTYYSVNEPVRE